MLTRMLSMASLSRGRKYSSRPKRCPASVKGWRQRALHTSPRKGKVTTLPAVLYWRRDRGERDSYKFDRRGHPARSFRDSTLIAFFSSPAPSNRTGAGRALESARGNIYHRSHSSTTPKHAREVT
jgi:hypothetical protein